MAQVAERVGAEALDQIRKRFDLSESEVAALFGVSRPAVAKWRLRGVPPERCADVDRVRELSGYLVKKFLPLRLPQIVRTPGRGLGGKTVLAVLAADGVGPVYAYLERLFAYVPQQLQSSVQRIACGGVYSRVCDPTWVDPLDTSFSAKVGGRWNPSGGFGALYLNADITVAAANARRAYENEIATLFDLRPEERPDLLYVQIAFNDFVDATTNGGLADLGLSETYPIGVPRETCQQIGSALHASGELGIACRTADAIEIVGDTVEGDELVVFDRAMHVVSRLNRVRFSEWYPLDR